MRKVLLTLALVGLLAVPAVLAQRGGFGRGGFGFGRGGMVIDASTLLANKSVQAELKLSDDQKKDLKEINKARALLRAAREDDDKDAAKEAQASLEKATKKLKESLTSAQSKRLLQIEVQLAVKRNNAKIFENTEVQKALKLTDKQKKLVKTTFSEMEKDLRELREEAKSDPKKFREVFQKQREMSKEAFTTITKSFDDDQKKAWKDLPGEEFEGKGFPFEMGFPGFGQDRGKDRPKFGRDKRGKRDKKKRTDDDA